MKSLIWHPCFRFIDRGAKTKRKERLSGGGREGKGGARWEGDPAAASGLQSHSDTAPPTKEERMRMCVVRGCTREVTSTVSKKWLIRLRKKLNAKKVPANADSLAGLKKVGPRLREYFRQVEARAGTKFTKPGAHFLAHGRNIFV